MTLQELAQIGGVVGVIASLIYVAIQIRNNSRATRAATFQQLSSTMASGWLDHARNPEMVDLILRGTNDFESLNRVEKARARFFLMGYARNFENAFFQHKVGTLKNKDWLGISADIHILFSMPGSRIMWPLIKNRSSPEFGHFIDAIVNAANAKQAAIDTAKPDETKPAIKTRRKQAKPKST